MMKRIPGLAFVCLVAVFQAHGQKLSVHEPAAIRSTDDLAARYIQFQSDYLPIITPSADRMFLQSASPLLPFDQAGFGKRFLKNLVGTMHPVSGAPVYTLYAMEDAKDCSVVVFNAELKELARIPRKPTYDPRAWVLGKYGASATPNLLALYNPARMIGEFQIIPTEYYDSHMAALEQQAALEAAAMPMMMSMAPPPPDGSSVGTGSVTFVSGSGTNGSIASMVTDSNSVVTMAITVPEHFGGEHLEIFSKDNLVYSPGWNISKAWLPTYGEPTMSWTDPSSGSKDACYYIISDADADSDGDGFSDLREAIFEGTSPTNFNVVDLDSDGMHDWYEILLFGDTNQTPTGDFDADGLDNNEEVVFGAGVGNPPTWLSDPSLADSDGDSMDDYAETVTYPFLDPLNKNDRDFDGDGLDNTTEHSLGSALDDYDTDDDGLSDGYEHKYGLSVFVPDDLSSDLDGDNLTLAAEYKYDTNPGLKDTDGDLVDDNIEVAQKSSPTSASDGGEPPEAGGTLNVVIELGDNLTSANDQFEMVITGNKTIRIVSGERGDYWTKETNTFTRGVSYTMKVNLKQHFGESTGDSFYAYVKTETGVIVEDPDSLLGYTTAHGNCDIDTWFFLQSRTKPISISTPPLSETTNPWVLLSTAN